MYWGIDLRGACHVLEERRSLNAARQNYVREAAYALCLAVFRWGVR